MIRFETTIQQFGSQGEKTGWTYIPITAEQAGKLKSGNRKGFRVKGKFDDYSFRGLALIPMGGGDFILCLNATVRKAIKKRKGAKVKVQLDADDTFKIVPPKDVLECFEDEPDAKNHFYSLTKSHQDYFIKWIESAKTIETRSKRIAQMINALARGWGYPEMLRAAKANKLD